MSGTSITGTDAAETLAGGGAGDAIFGAGGDDQIEGGDGDDSVVGGDGNDTVAGDLFGTGAFPPDPEGGLGDDVVAGGAGDDFLFGGRGDDLASGGDGDDLVTGGSDRDTVLGGEGDDRLWGGRPQAAFFEDRDPEDGPDLVLGGGGNDDLRGGRGNDTLLGESGDDTVAGGFGADALTGGGGADLFAFGTREVNFFQSTQASIDTGLGTEADAVLDFQRGEDRIDLSVVNSFSLRFVAVGDFAFDFVGTDAFSGERPEVRYDIVGDRTVVQLDGVAIRLVSLPQQGGVPAVIEVPTDGVADAEIVLAGRVDLQETDFLL